MDDLIATFESGPVEVTSHETMLFALDGIDYEVDLVPQQASSLRGILERYIKAGRRVPDVFLVPSHGLHGLF